MCKELKLIQNKLGIYNIADWSIKTACIQLNKQETMFGVYIIKNIKNNMILVGEGRLGGGGTQARPISHIAGKTKNKKWLNDLKIYGIDNFILSGIILENDELKRQEYEYNLQKFFNKNCYNTSRVKQPLQQDILKNLKFIEKINNFIETDGGYKDKCHKTLWSTNQDNYGRIGIDNKRYQHHIVSYILHHGNYNMFLTIDHKCGNQWCVNPNHLEAISNKTNIRRYHNSDYIENEIKKLELLNLNSQEIAKQLKIDITLVRRCMKFTHASKFIGVTINHNKNWNRTQKEIIYKAAVQYKKFNKNINLGSYISEIEAAKNRDYFIIKNNLLNEKWSTLNFHDTDYTNFIPYPSINNKINKYLL